MADSALTIEALILEEVRGLRGDIQGMGQRIAILEAHDHDISGNGQAGRMKDAEDKIDDLGRWRWTITGAGMALASLGGIFGSWIFEHFFKK